jgi:hypothetical protein
MEATNAGQPALKEEPMINIQNTKTFFYDQDRSTVTVYGDFDDPNKWYIVPSATFAREEVSGASLPAFSLVEYNTNEGRQGTCSFTAELMVPPGALQAVYDNLGQGITLGQFDWVNAQAFFVFEVGGQQYTVNAVPSRYATNRAAFVIHLLDQEWVNTFKTAFGPGQGTVSPFRIEYAVLALSKLPAVTVTVTYDSQIAYDYEKTVKVDKNVWGKETGRRETIKEELRNSDAGNTVVDWNMPNPSPELQQRVLDWAWVTLEGLVEKAVDDTIRFLGENNADQISMSQTASFERAYSENQVIEWAITPFAQLPAFDAALWQKLYRETDVRNLAVSFTVRDDLMTAGIKLVQVTVNYPTNLTSNTCLFTPTSPTSWTYTADGTDPFDNRYEYKYIVEYEEPGKKFESLWIAETSSTVVLPLTDLGIQKAVFIGSNIDFANQVDFVLIDFFFNLPNGQNKHEQQRMTDNTTPIEIASRTYLPSTNEYTYQLTYVLKNKQVLQVASQKVFPPQNSELVTIYSPLGKKVYSLGVINPPPLDPIPAITYVQVAANYEDPQNKNSEFHQWDFEVPAGSRYYKAPNWTLDVVNNPSGSYVQYDGMLILSSGEMRELTDIRIQTPFINLSALQTPFTAEVDPFQIDWAGGVTMVQVDLFTLPNNPLKADDIEAEIDDRTQIAAMTFMQQASGATPAQYYTFLNPVNAPLVYYYRATYFHQTGPDTYVQETASQAKKITLPKDGTGTTPMYLRIELQPEVAEPAHAVA